QDGALDLSARHGRLVIERAEALAAPEPVDVERRVEHALLRAGRAVEVRAACPERLDDAAHGATRERLVADELAREALRDEDAREQPHRGAAVAAVEGALRRREPAKPLPGDARGVAVELDVDAHGAEGVGRREVVEAAGEPVDAALSLGQRREDERAMPDGFVTGDAGLAAERARGADSEALHRHLAGGHSKAPQAKPREG